MSEGPFWKRKWPYELKFILKAPFSHPIFLQRKSPKFQKIREIWRAAVFSLVQDDIWIKIYEKKKNIWVWTGSPFSSLWKSACGAFPGEARGKASPIHSHARAFGHRLPNFYLVFSLPWPSHQSTPFPNAVGTKEGIVKKIVWKIIFSLNLLCSYFTLFPTATSFLSSRISEPPNYWHLGSQ